MCHCVCVCVCSSRFEALAELLWRNRQLAKQLPAELPQNLIAGDQFMALTHQFTQQLLLIIQMYVNLL